MGKYYDLRGRRFHRCAGKDLAFSPPFTSSSDMLHATQPLSSASSLALLGHQIQSARIQVPGRRVLTRSFSCRRDLLKYSVNAPLNQHFVIVSTVLHKIGSSSRYQQLQPDVLKSNRYTQQITSGSSYSRETCRHPRSRANRLA